MTIQTSDVLSRISSKVGGKKAALLLREIREKVKGHLNPVDEEYDYCVEQLLREKLDSLKEVKNYW